LRLRCRFCSARRSHYEQRHQSRSISRNRLLTCSKMGGPFSPPRFQVAVTVISPRGDPSKCWKRNELIIRACTARSSIPAGTRLLQTRMRTCRYRAEENLFPRRCITSCGSPVPMECMQDIYLATQHRMAVFGCRNGTRSHFSMRSVSALRSRCMAGRRRGATWENRDRHFHGSKIDFEIRGSIRDLHRLRHHGGGDNGNHARHRSRRDCSTEQRRRASL
jgi:hypothetical protein